jgi:hypothetical protein
MLEAFSEPGPVQLVEPNGGETWSDDGTVRVRWEASDPDGDSLTAAVQFSADGGRTWRAVVRDVTESQARLEASLIPGSSAGLIRVCVSDGVNTACDDSDAIFQVAGKPPEASISSPQDGGTFPTGVQVILQASASDLEDGPLPQSASYAWTSSLDGELGQGDLLWDLPLSPGRHRLTLTVTDGDGLSATDTVTIIVGQESTPRPPVAGLGLVLGGLVVLGLVAVAMLIFAVRGRSFRSR